MGVKKFYAVIILCQNLSDIIMNKILCNLLLITTFSFVGCAKPEHIPSNNEYQWMERISENRTSYLERFVDCDSKTVIYSLSYDIEVIPQSDVDNKIFEKCKEN